MRVAAALSAALAAQELALFFEQPRTHAARAELARTLPVCGWVGEAQEASCEGSDDAACDDERHGPPVVRLLGADGSSRGFETTLTASAERSRTVDTAAARRLLRVRAPESAMPGLNWAVGLDALRVLEWADEERLDWLLSVQADELEDLIERIQCGVHGSRFQSSSRGARRGAPDGCVTGAQFQLELLPERGALAPPASSHVPAQ